jgi:hypothetical protein
MVETIIGETKREGQREAKKHTTHKNKKKREKVSAFCGRKLFCP